MIEYTHVGGQGSLRPETKVNWARGTLAADTNFIHGTAAPPSKVDKFGISPLYAGEYLIDPQGLPIAGGKMIFAFKAVANVRAPANAYKRSPAVERMFGRGHAYVFRAPAGTVYYSTNGSCGTGSEIAFPYIVESSDILFYLPPDSDENLPWTSRKAIIAMAG